MIRQLQIVVLLTTYLLIRTEDEQQITFTDIDDQESPVKQELPEDQPTYGTEIQPRSNRCSCMPSYQCQPVPPSTGAGQIDIRIVTKAPPGMTCGEGSLYCCYTQPKPTQCGTRPRNLMPGVNLEPGQAYFGEYPWQAVILSTENQFIGGGALLDRTHVISAAHKVAPYVPMGIAGLKVRLGEWNVQDNNEPFKYIEFKIARIVTHPCYNANNLQNDVVVITLTEPVPLGIWPHINTVCMAQPNMVLTGQRCWVSGWGKDAFGPAGKYQFIQKEVDVPILDTKDCERRLRGTRLGNYFLLDQTSFLCAGGEMGKDACTGDGGSPLVCEQGGTFYLVGMVAWGIGCAQSNIPGVYVNVLNYYTWISQQLQR